MAVSARLLGFVSSFYVYSVGCILGLCLAVAFRHKFMQGVCRLVFLLCQFVYS
jgi:hypothetical protein